ncbi:hypothetical protein GCM10020229_66010 [Kitasatospora albolonga]|uniref:DUF6221 family protein n=1 Tax=Kitasatospora albolonga TaxID=68173 RepID=UPI0031E889F8
MTEDLPAFLRARFAEDRQAALEAHPQAASGWWAADAATPVERYLARWRPSRVLAETAAKQQLLELANAECAPACRVEHAFDAGCGLRWMGPLHVEEDGGRWLRDDTGARFAPPPVTPLATLRLLALPYVDHPGYRREWAPGL